MRSIFIMGIFPQTAISGESDKVGKVVKVKVAG